MIVPRYLSRTAASQNLIVRSLILFSCLVAKPATATQRTYNILTNQSSITASGTVDYSSASAPIQPQGEDSLTTSYTGTIKADRGANNIRFLSGSTIDANSNGSWKPLADGSDGSATADYGGKATFYLIVTVNFAGRNLVAGLTSGALPIDGSGQFDLATTYVTFASGDLSYRGPGGTVGVASIAGENSLLSGTGSLNTLVQGAQTTETLTIPVDSTFVLQPDSSTTIHLTLNGTLIATSAFATPLPGDYNNDGVVDAGDYVVWRKNDGSGTSLPNDDTSGVGQDDYMRWRTHFGESLGVNGSEGSALSGSSVPETSTLALLVGALVFVGLGYHRDV